MELASLRVVKQLEPRKYVSGLLQFEGHMRPGRVRVRFSTDLLGPQRRFFFASLLGVAIVFQFLKHMLFFFVSFPWLVSKFFSPFITGHILIFGKVLKQTEVVFATCESIVILGTLVHVAWMLELELFAN